MAHKSRSPPRQRPRYPGDRTEEYSRRDSSEGGFRGREDRNSGGPRTHVNNGWGNRDKDRPSDRNRGYSGRDERHLEYDERERARDRDRDRERYRDSARDRDRAGPSRRSASPSRPLSARSRSRSHSGSKSATAVDKSKPNFAPSGLLAAATNTVKAADGTSTVLKYNEPPEARKPILGWRLYVFKGNEQVELLHIHRQSAYLIGRDRTVADISIDHPSCSKQHAVIQYRHVHEKDEFGGSKGVIKPFIIDLESTNGTLVNDEKIPISRYYELKASDVIKFGQSTREYVLLHDEAT